MKIITAITISAGLIVVMNQSVANPTPEPIPTVTAYEYIENTYDYQGERQALRHTAQVNEAQRARSKHNENAKVKNTRIRAVSRSKPNNRQLQNNYSVWQALAVCESGGNWSINSGNGYYGGLQFKKESWWDVGGTGLPHEHSKETQIHFAIKLQKRYGWGQWPACSRKLGLR